MGKLNRQVLLALTFSVAVGCSGTPTVPIVTTATITGTVTTSAPTFTPLAGVTLTVVDGPAAGKSTTADDTGQFSLTTVKGPVTLRASREGYESQAVTVDLTAAQHVRFTLKPVPAVLTLKLSPEMGVAGTCGMPCRIYTLHVHNDGDISAGVRWNVFGIGLTVSLWRGDVQLATSTRFNTLNHGFTAVRVAGGVTYHLRVTAGPETELPNFEVSLTRPS